MTVSNLQRALAEELGTPYEILTPAEIAAVVSRRGVVQRYIASLIAQHGERNVLVVSLDRRARQPARGESSPEPAAAARLSREHETHRRLVVAAALVGCQSSRSSRQPDASKRQAPRAQAAAREAGGRFFARGTAGDAHELKLHKLAVDVTTQPGTVRSHLTHGGRDRGRRAVRGDHPPARPARRGRDRRRAVGERQADARRVRRAPARADIYTSIVTRRRDPALVTWDGPGWIAVSIYPLEKNRSRRFELEWVEPAAVADGRVQYRVPIVAERERVVGRASVKVDGRRVAGDAARSDRHRRRPIRTRCSRGGRRAIRSSR